MAVQDKYINANQAAGKLGNPAFLQGAPILSLVSTEEIADADSNTSVFRIGTLPSNAIIKNILINNDALTNGTDFDLGLANVGVGGATIDADVFLNGGNLSAAHAVGSELSGISALGVDVLYKKLYEHAGHTVVNKKEGYDLILTGNTIGTVGGTVVIRVDYILG